MNDSVAVPLGLAYVKMRFVENPLIAAVSAPGVARPIVNVMALLLVCPAKFPLEQLRAVRVTGNVPTCVGEPVIAPVVELTLSPVGNPLAM